MTKVPVNFALRLVVELPPGQEQFELTRSSFVLCLPLARIERRALSRLLRVVSPDLALLLDKGPVGFLTCQIEKAPPLPLLQWLSALFSPSLESRQPKLSPGRGGRPVPSSPDLDGDA